MMGGMNYLYTNRSVNSDKNTGAASVCVKETSIVKYMHL